MHTRSSKGLIAVFVSIFLFASALPALAQEGDSDPTATNENILIGGEFSETSEPPTFTPTLTQEPTSTSTPTATLTLTETPTITSTPIEPTGTETQPSLTPSASPESTSTFTPTVTFTSTATLSTSTPQTVGSTCSMNDVHQSQIIVGYNKPKSPASSPRYVVVENFQGGEGIHVSVIKVKEGDFCSVLSELSEDPSVLFVEPNYSISLLQTIPNDPNLPAQYYLNNILAYQGWDYTTGSPAVTIAILDTGVDLSHIELAVKILPGHDYIDGDDIPQDENGHGTLVAGIAAANTNNGIGVAGVSWGAQIMPLRVLDAAGNGTNADLAQAIMWATAHGARVINMSLGGSNYSLAVEAAVDYAVNAGVVLVAATGNTGSPMVLYPAAYPGVIGVGATDSINQLAPFSNTGAEVDLVAPGVSIFGPYLGNSYTFLSGTSMAAPQVAGFAALLASLPGVVYSSQIVTIMQSTALDLGVHGWDSGYGFGLIQIGPAIQSVISAVGTATPTRTQSPTATQFGIWTTTTSSNTPTFTPTQTLTWIVTEVSRDNNHPTPTQGEVYMLQPQVLTITPEGVASNLFDYSSCFVASFGVLCILVGIGLFIYVRRKHYS